MTWWTPARKGLAIGAFFGVLYGLFARYLFIQPSGTFVSSFSVMSLAFLFVIPFVIGWISVAGAQITKTTAFFWPMFPILLGCLMTFAFQFEGVICIVMYLPAAVIIAGIGGLFRLRQLRQGSKKGQYAILLLPFLVGPVESTLTPPNESHDVRSEIVIHAPASRVWNEIKSVRTITRNELKDSWVHTMGFPRPLDAVINHEGLGGVRLARFEGQLVFNETVTEWVPEKVLGFDIVVDPKSIPPTTLDEHVTIGGAYFDVLHGTYELESRGNETVLHLKSRFRLSTHFNAYAGFWSSIVMNRIQSDILSVVRDRAEHAAVARN